jgi:signal peptidase I
VATGLAGGMLLFAAFVAYWALSGGRWYIVETPSMGTAAPVGTLLWVAPTPFESIHVGEIITFHPPISPGETYSHRVVAINTDGTLSTKGDINGAVDPWRLQASNVIGRVAMRWWDIGWLVRAAPLLIGGGLILGLLVTRFTTARWKPPAVIAGSAVVVALAIYIYRPLVRAALISFAPESRGGRATYVSTGLLPTRLSAPHGGHVDLIDGRVGSILSTHANRHGRFQVTFGPHLPWWWWAVLVGVCFLPPLWTVTVGRPPDGESTTTALTAGAA